MQKFNIFINLLVIMVSIFITVSTTDLDLNIKYKTFPPIIGALSMLPEKKVAMGLQNPVMLEKEKYTISLRAIDYLIGSVKIKRGFQRLITSRQLKGGVVTKKITGHRE